MTLIGLIKCKLFRDHDASDFDINSLFEHHFARLEVFCIHCGAIINISPVLESKEQEYYVEEFVPN